MSEESHELDDLNEYLDGEGHDLCDLDGVSKQELARHLLVAGVTRHLLQESADARRTEDLVRDGMVSIVANDRRRRMRRVLGIAASAAAVLAMLVLFFLPKEDNLDVLLDRVTAFVVDDLDREYSITLDTKGMGPPRHVHPTLYTRGTDLYAGGFEANSPLGRGKLGVWQGFNGTDNWIVIPDLANFIDPDAHTPVLVTSGSLIDLWGADEFTMIRPLAQGMNQLENALGIFSLLATMRPDYDFEKTPATATKIAKGEGLVDVTARRHSYADIGLPDTIRLLVEEETGVVRTIVLKFNEVPNGMGIENPFRSIRYDLVKETIAGDNLYDYTSYADPARPVERR